MKNRTEPFSSVPELRQQVFEEWYAAEWSDQESASSTQGASQGVQPIAHLSGNISRLMQVTDSAMAFLRVRMGLRRVFPLQDHPLGN